MKTNRCHTLFFLALPALLLFRLFFDASPSSTLRVGSRAPGLASQPQHSAFVLAFIPSNFIQQKSSADLYMAGLESIRRRGFFVLAVQEGNHAANSPFADLVVSDTNGTIARLYGVQPSPIADKFPVTFIVDANGFVNHIDWGRDALSTFASAAACARLSNSSPLQNFHNLPVISAVRIY